MTNFTKITLFILLLSILSSCNSIKRLKEDQFLLTENKVIVNDKKTSDLELLSYINQRPNQKVLGVPFSLYIHNWAKPNFENSVNEWSINHTRTTKFINNIFSTKQIDEVYLFNKKVNSLLKKNGEFPVIINEQKTNKSVKTLKKYYRYKGFFDAEISASTVDVGAKKKRIEYVIKTNEPYLINKYIIEIESPALEEIYNRHKENSFIKEGNQYNRTDFVNEQKRLTELFRNSGVYYFNENYIYFDGIISESVTNLKNVKLIIKNRIIQEGENTVTVPFKVRKVTKVNIYTDFAFSVKHKEYETIENYNGYTFYARNKLKFNSKKLANNIAITPNKVYKDLELSLTKQYLNDIKIFRSPINIRYLENKDGNLTANINLIPLEKFGVNLAGELTHSNIKPFGVLGKFGIFDRNLFRGSEILDFSIQGSFLNVATDASDPEFNVLGLKAWEIGANMSFNIPRLLFPVKTTRLIPKRMRPSTNIGLSTSFQKNIGLDRQNITGNISYNWHVKKKVKHQFDLLNVQYINNLNSGNYFEVFRSELVKLSNVTQNITDVNSVNSDGKITNTSAYINYVLNPSNSFVHTNFEDYKRVQQVKERKDIITEDILVPVMSYSYTYNGKENIKDKNFSFLNLRLVSAGSITSLLSNQGTNDRKELFGLPIAQYIKTEIEYKKYWNLYSNNQLVFRTFIGAAVPFGNSTEIPFSRSYRAGGSNDIRAWKTFDLGPGSSVSNLDFNIGNLKLVSNFEYRFKIINSFYSALFIDAGNVWDLTNSDITNNPAKFKGLNSFKEIAIGSGFGLRYDLSFLIFRSDFGFKTYEPYLIGNKWLQNYNFKHAVFNFGINYPF